MAKFSNKHTKVLSVFSEVFESTQFLLMITRAILAILDYYLVIPGCLLGIIRACARLYLINVPSSSPVYAKYKNDRRKENIRLGVQIFFYLVSIIVAAVGLAFLGNALREIAVNAVFVAEDFVSAVFTLEKGTRVRKQLQQKQHNGVALTKSEKTRSKKRIFKNAESISRLLLTIGGILVLFGILSGPWGLAVTVLVAAFLIGRSIYEGVRCGIELRELAESEAAPLLVATQEPTAVVISAPQNGQQQDLQQQNLQPQQSSINEQKTDADAIKPIKVTNDIVPERDIVDIEEKNSSVVLQPVPLVQMQYPNLNSEPYDSAELIATNSENSLSGTTATVGATTDQSWDLSCGEPIVGSLYRNSVEKQRGSFKRHNEAEIEQALELSIKGHKTVKTAMKL